METDVINGLVGTKFNKIFKQLNLFIINFSKPIKYSLHVACMVRVCDGSNIVLTAADEFFTKDGLHKSDEIYKRLEKEGILVDPNDLLSHNLKSVNTLLKNSYVVKVEISKWMDLFIYFDNNIVIQVFPDCLEKDYEYYRFIKFIPELSNNIDNCLSEHFIVINNNGKLEFKCEDDKL